MADLYFKRLFAAPQQSFFLFGPRGTGKSTLIKMGMPNALVINLLLPDSRRRYLANPEYLLEVVRAQPRGKTIVLDEIQRAPELLSMVHALIEEKKDWQFILTGSSARKLKNSGVDLLGGRALKKMLHPFMAVELGENFNFEAALAYGMLPLLWGTQEPAETLKSYISLYLDEEVKAEGIVRNLAPFSRFLEILSFSHGSVLNLSNVARECGVKRSTAESWLGIAEELLIAYRIPVFSKRAKRILIQHSKFYFFDVGVFRALRPRAVLDNRSEIDGSGLEGLVAQHLQAWIDYTKEKHQLCFWRTKSGVEVDFIVYGPLGFLAIEVKNSTHIHPADLRSLKTFLTDYPESRALFLYRGKDMLLKDGVLCMPAEDFLRQLTPNSPLISQDP